jgi:AcrR family transcriptional regulator
VTELRTYGGRSGADRLAERRVRLVEAGRTLLTAEGGPGGFTLRAVCRETGLTARYFYESFADTGELARTVYDECIATITTQTLAAMAKVGDDPAEAVRAALGALVDLIAADPSRGRLLFSPALAVVPEIAAQRAASTRLFVDLVGAEASSRTALTGGPRLLVTAELLVGGVAQVVSAWLDGHLTATRDEVVEVCATSFLAVGEALDAFRDGRPRD